MIRSSLLWRPALLAIGLALAGPALAQSTDAEARLRKLEAEMRAVQRTVFPGGDGKFFAPQVQPGSSTTTSGTPASTPTADLLARMDAVEAALAKVTAQGEENANKIAQLEARLANAAPAATPAGAATTPTTLASGSTTAGNLSAMSGGSSSAAATKPASTPPAAAPKPASAKPAAAGPSAQRLAAVKAVEKPETDDPGDDAYSYGFRLWEKKFYPEAQQQLKLFLEKYPRHARLSYARNLLGRAYLDAGDPREAAKWFLQNYQANKAGERAPDSVLFLAESMRQIKDTTRACVALAQFADDYPREAAGRLKAQYDTTRSGVTCN